MRRPLWGVGAGDVLAIVGSIVAPSVLITGLLYYFGWIRARFALVYFGIDTNLIEYSTSDYVLRSVNIVFESSIRIAFIALILLVFHQLVVLRALDMPAESRARHGVQWFVFIMHFVGFSLLPLVVIGVLAPGVISQFLGLTVPLLLIVSVTLLGYVTYLRFAYSDALTRTRRCASAVVVNQDVESEDYRGTPLRPDDEQNIDVDEPRHGIRLHGMFKRVPEIWLRPYVNPHPRAQLLVLIALGLLGFLWTVSLYAERVGRNAATGLVADFPNRSMVVVYSTERIAIAGPGVKVDEINQPGSKYRYKYTGLRLLIRSSDKYLLLPVNWQRGRDHVFVVQDDESIRIDVKASSNLDPYGRL